MPSRRVLLFRSPPLAGSAGRPNHKIAAPQTAQLSIPPNLAAARSAHGAHPHQHRPRLGDHPSPIGLSDPSELPPAGTTLRTAHIHILGIRSHAPEPLPIPRIPPIPSRDLGDVR